MKKVFKFVKGKKDEKKEGAGGGVVRSQSGELVSPARTPEDELFSGPDAAAGYVVDFSGKDKTLTKLHKAAWQGSLEKLKSALKKVEINAVDRRNRTALHFAVVRGHPNIVWFLLGNNADAGVCDDEGRTPLLKAIECGHKECANLLLERGTDVNVADYAGNTALHVATGQGSPDAVSVLLKKGADPEIGNNAGDYPLHIATKLESKDLVDLLLNSEASVDVLDREHRTPLMLAAKSGNLLLAQLFVERGAQLSVVDSNGWTAQDYAILSGHENVAASLRAAGKIETEVPAEAKPERQESESKSDDDGGGDSWSQSKSEACGKDLISQKLRTFFKKCSKEEQDVSEKDKHEDVPDSPSTDADAMPPYCQPPRSWEMIQAGMIDEVKTGVESKRRSITALGTLYSRRESFADASGAASPKYTLSLNRRKPARNDDSFARQRFSFNEDSSKCWHGDGKTAHEKQENLSPQNNSSAAESEWDGDFSSSARGPEEESAPVPKDASPDGPGPTGREEEDPFPNPSGLPSLESRSAGEIFRDGFPPPPTALELGVDMARSMKFSKGISEDHSLGRAGERRFWKMAHETNSVDYLEEKEAADEPRESAPFGKRRSEDMSRCPKPWDRPFDANRRINEQLECYDQALRELAESSQKIYDPHGYHSLPSAKTREDFEARKTNSLSRSLGKNFLEVSGKISANGESSSDSRREASTKSDDGGQFPPWEQGKKLERQTKRQMLLAMRDIKHAVHVANTFKTSSDDHILSPLATPENGFDSEDAQALESSAKDDSADVGSGPKEEDEARERRKSSSSDTGEEPTLWLQDDVQTKTQATLPLHNSEEDVSEISEEEEEETKHQRTSSFSPLGVIYKEIQKETRNSERSPSGEENGRRGRSEPEEPWDQTNGEEEEIIREQSPDVSLSSGPIEPLGADKDSGSEPESSHNDVTPTRHFSFEAQHEWLKSHLKTATSEKSKLEEVTAQLSEKTERLQYELADAKEAAKSRDEVIHLLQGQLARMEAAYTKSLEESVQSRLQLSSHEQEILHLKELCYRYEEEKADAPAVDFEDLELRIKALEDEKRKMKEEIWNLEQEKSFLEKRLKDMAGPDAADQCRRWKERWKEPENNYSDSSEPSQDSEKTTRETKNRICDLEKRIAEISEENAQLKSELKCLVTEIEFDKKARKDIEDYIEKLERKNLEMEVLLKKTKFESEERKRKEEEEEPSVRPAPDGPPENEVRATRSEEGPDPKTDPRTETELSDLKNRMNSLVALLLEGRTPSGADPGERLPREALDREARSLSRRRGAGREDELAWSSLYGMKFSARRDDRAAETSADRTEKAQALEARETRPTFGIDYYSRPAVEFLNLKRELLVLQKKMAEEKNLRLMLESQIAEMNLDLTEKQNLQQEIQSLKREMDKDCVRRFETDLLRYQKDLESKREKYFGGGGGKVAGRELELKCERLAKEREKSKEIRRKLWTEPGSGGAEPPAPPVGSYSHPRSRGQTEILPRFVLEPEVKNQLEEKLDISIRKYSTDFSSQSMPKLKTADASYK